MRELLQEFIRQPPYGQLVDEQPITKDTDKATRQVKEESTECSIEQKQNIEYSVKAKNPNEISAATYTSISWLFVFFCILLN